MSIKYYYGPRQVGKTTEAVRLYLRDPENSIIVCCNNDTRNQIRRIINPVSNHHPYIVKPERVVVGTHVDALRGRNFKHVIFDEFDFLPIKRQHELFEDLAPQVANDGTITIYTTMRDLIDKDVYDDVIYLKKRYRSYEQYMNELSDRMVIPKTFKSALKKMKEMWDSIITMPGVELTPFRMVKQPYYQKKSDNELWHEYGALRYTTDIKGHIFGPELTEPKKERPRDRTGEALFMTVVTSIMKEKEQERYDAREYLFN